MSKPKSPYGKAVQDGEARYTSASSLTLADPNSYGGCLRAWWYDKVGKVAQIETAAMHRGTHQLHKPIEDYYQTGRRAFGPLASALTPWMPSPGPDLLVEWEISRPFGKPDHPLDDVSQAPLKLAGLPVVGKMDITHARGWYHDAEGVLKEDPPNTIEHLDWKSTSAREYAKSPDQLRKAVQMITYGAWGLTWAPETEQTRLSHGYSLTKGTAQGWKATVLVPRDEIERGAAHITGIAQTIQQAARMTSAEQVDANTRSCDAYGRGCPHKRSGLCSAGNHNSLANTFGVGALSQLLSLSKKETSMKPTDLLAQLEAEEIEAKAAFTKPVSILTPELRTAFSIIALAGMGRPVYKGDAAKAFVEYELLAGRAAPGGETIQGEGKLMGLNAVETLDFVIGLGNDLKARAERTQARALASETGIPLTPAIVTPPITEVPMSLLPPDAPASDPKLAADPVEGFGLTSPEFSIEPPPELETPKKKRGRPAKADAVAVQTGAISDSPQSNDALLEAKRRAHAELKELRSSEGPSFLERHGVQPPSNANTLATQRLTTNEGEFTDLPFELYIDAIPSLPFTLLDDVIAQWCNALVKFFKTPEDPSDIRCLSDNRMGFGKWKGVLAALVRESLIDSKLERKRYVVMTSGSEINQVVVEAMLTANVLDLYVRGVR